MPDHVRYHVGECMHENCKEPNIDGYAYCARHELLYRANTGKSSEHLDYADAVAWNIFGSVFDDQV